MIVPLIRPSDAAELSDALATHNWNREMCQKAAAQETDVTWKEIQIHEVPASLASVTQSYNVLCTRCREPAIEKVLLQYSTRFKCSNQSCTNRHLRGAVAFPGDDQKGVDPARNPLCYCNVVSRSKKIYVDPADVRKGSEEIFECAALRCNFGHEDRHKPIVKMRL
ncbi:hypothetical protein CERZMDRAFT_80695 [Cercospora zeae-maydis SCOH1-5]|uniref:Uncharacterized protein n=1 Tax=Cercospora zeae-maydis SCOH1-5 TaxID=717836 RepID=A0A6A6FXE6_9PEZI|nr:hypothetical protein CERZMDRAFT_80695 [Cercospora zeae-maydis SCOH1-5]